MDHPLPWLRYVGASTLDDDQTLRFNGLKVRNSAMETLGKVDGFIIDSRTARPYYVVVDSGGWFKSKDYLVPVGFAKIDGDNDALVVDLTKERIERFPGFNKDAFERMSEDELRRFSDETCNTGTTTGVAVAESYTTTWDRPEYAMPGWWSPAMFPDRMGETAFSTGAEYPPSKVAPVTSTTSADVARATAQSAADRGDQIPKRTEVEDSPFYDGRAQPGDVLGLDTGGERTYVGDTSEDENKRRRDAEEAAAKAR
jgi:hypothetical protein